jgi:hypothetical protein
MSNYNAADYSIEPLSSFEIYVSGHLHGRTMLTCANQMRPSAGHETGRTKRNEVPKSSLTSRRTRGNRESRPCVFSNYSRM